MNRVSQSCNNLILVRPANFGFSSEAAKSNTFQNQAKSTENDQNEALKEFDNFVQILREQNIDLTIAEDTLEPKKPDAIFPNNWFSTWPNGNVYLYPMEPPTRRAERRSDIIEGLKSNFDVTDVIDLSASEKENKFLESTGAMVFNHLGRVAYGAISPRCNEELFLQHTRDLDYKPILFNTSGPNDQPIYHTNVLMGIQTSTAIVCSEIIEPSYRKRVLAELNADKEVVTISFEQMCSFAGNVLEVLSKTDQKFLILSDSAHKALKPDQRKILGRDKTLLPIPIPTIENVGGGSVRCMIAENFLPTCKNRS